MVFEGLDAMEKHERSESYEPLCEPETLDEHEREASQVLDLDELEKNMKHLDFPIFFFE